MSLSTVSLLTLHDNLDGQRADYSADVPKELQVTLCFLKCFVPANIWCSIYYYPITNQMTVSLGCDLKDYVLNNREVYLYNQILGLQMMTLQT